MKWVILVLIVLAVLLVAALVWSSVRRKQDQVARERAGELRSEAAENAVAQHQQEARAREVNAEAERARAQADQLEVRAAEEKNAYDQTRAQREDAVREADRVDPDVDHQSTGYEPDLNGAPSHRVSPRDTPPQNPGI